MKYNLNNFLKNYKEDKKVFGDATKCLYENFFSYIMGNKVTINEEFINNIIFEDMLSEEELANEIFTEGAVLTESNPLINGLKADLRSNRKAERELRSQLKNVKTAYSNQEATANELEKAQRRLDKALKDSKEAEEAVNALQSIDKAAMKVDAVTGLGPMENPVRLIDHPEEVAKPLGFFGKLKNKITTFFSGDNSISNIFKKGFKWLTDPANLSKVLLTGGGVAIVAVILNILRKKRKMKQYNMLQNNAKKALEDNNQVNENFENIISNDTLLSEEINDLLYNKTRYFNY